MTDRPVDNPETQDEQAEPDQADAEQAEATEPAADDQPEQQQPEDEFGTAETVEDLEAFADELNDELALDEDQLELERAAREAADQDDDDASDDLDEDDTDEAEPDVDDPASGMEPDDDSAGEDEDGEGDDDPDDEDETRSHAPGSIDTTGDEVDESDEQATDDDPDDEADEDETEQGETEVRLGPDGKPILPPGTDEPGLVESIILVSANPISAGKIAKTLSSEGFTPGKVKAIVGHLNECYATEGRAFRIQEIAGGYQFYTLAPYADVLTRLVKAPTEISLSQAALEVLAIVAYKQPIIRADIEAIRGVSCGPLLRHLLEINLVRIVGKSDQLGRPLLYGTTKKFLEHFGLGDLKDLPKSGTLSQPG